MVSGGPVVLEYHGKNAYPELVGIHQDHIGWPCGLGKL